MNNQKCVILLNPFTSIRYMVNFLRKNNYFVCAIFTTKNLQRSGYVLTELQKAKFDLVINLNKQSLEDDCYRVKNETQLYSIEYIFICSELDDYEYCEKITNYLLNNLSNNPETSHFRYNKFYMGEQLNKLNINAIKQVKASNYKSSDLHGKLLIKPLKESCSEKGIYYFNSQRQLIHHINKLTNKEDFLIQEKIEGEEYIVDCFSYQGKHHVIGIFKYEKNNPCLSIIQTAGTIDINCNINEMAHYAFSVLDAVEFKNGFAHLEIMVNQNGYYLIEVNPRLPGLVGLLPETCQISYHQHHLQIWHNLISHKQTNIIPVFNQTYATIFLVNNQFHDYHSLNQNYIESLLSFYKLHIIKTQAAKPKTQSRLNTVAFILLKNKDIDTIKTDINQLIKAQNKGSLFNQ